jgi:hypothetical protein
MPADFQVGEPVAVAVALARFTYSHGPRDVERTSAMLEGQEGQQGLSQAGQDQRGCLVSIRLAHNHFLVCVASG